MGLGVITETDAREGTPSFFSTADRYVERGRWLKHAVRTLVKDSRAVLQAELASHAMFAAFVDKMHAIVMDEAKCPDALIDDRKRAVMLDVMESAVTASSFREMFLLQFEQLLVEPLERTSNQDHKVVKEAKKKFDKIADDYENFLSKFSALRKPEKKSAQENYRKWNNKYQESALEYRSALLKFRDKQQKELPSLILGFGRANYSLYSQSFEGMKDIADAMSNLALDIQREESGEMHGLREKEEEEERELYETVNIDSATLNCNYRGHLFIMVNQGEKKATSRAWVRYYCVLDQAGTLLIMKERPKGNEAIVVDSFHMRNCLVRPLNKQFGRSYVFDVRTESSGVYKLQAESETSMNSWVTAVQKASQGNDAHRHARTDQSHESREAIRLERARQDKQYREYLQRRESQRTGGAGVSQSSASGSIGSAPALTTRELQERAHAQLREVAESQELYVAHRQQQMRPSSAMVSSTGVRLMSKAEAAQAPMPKNRLIAAAQAAAAARPSSTSALPAAAAAASATAIHPVRAYHPSTADDESNTLYERPWDLGSAPSTAPPPPPGASEAVNLDDTGPLYATTDDVMAVMKPSLKKAPITNAAPPPPIPTSARPPSSSSTSAASTPTIASASLSGSSMSPSVSGVPSRPAPAPPIRTVPSVTAVRPPAPQAPARRPRQRPSSEALFNSGNAPTTPPSVKPTPPAVPGSKPVMQPPTNRPPPVPSTPAAPPPASVAHLPHKLSFHYDEADTIDAAAHNYAEWDDPQDDDEDDDEEFKTKLTESRMRKALSKSSKESTLGGVSEEILSTGLVEAPDGYADDDDDDDDDADDYEVFEADEAMRRQYEESMRMEEEARKQRSLRRQEPIHDDDEDEKADEEEEEDDDEEGSSDDDDDDEDEDEEDEGDEEETDDSDDESVGSADSHLYEYPFIPESCRLGSFAADDLPPPPPLPSASFSPSTISDLPPAPDMSSLPLPDELIEVEVPEAPATVVTTPVPAPRRTSSSSGLSIATTTVTALSLSTPSTPTRPHLDLNPSLTVTENESPRDAATRVAGSDTVGELVEATMETLIARNCTVDEVGDEKIRVKPRGSLTPGEHKVIAKHKAAFLAYIRVAKAEQTQRIYDRLSTRGATAKGTSGKSVYADPESLTTTTQYKSVRPSNSFSSETSASPSVQYTAMNAGGGAAPPRPSPRPVNAITDDSRPAPPAPVALTVAGATATLPPPPEYTRMPAPRPQPRPSSVTLSSPVHAPAPSSSTPAGQPPAVPKRPNSNLKLQNSSGGESMA